MTTFYDKTGLPKSLAWGFIGVLIFMMGDGIEQTWLSRYIASQGLDHEVLFTVYGISVALSAWFSGVIAETIGVRRTMLLGYLVYLVGMAGFAGIGMMGLNYPVLLVTYAIKGLGYPLFAYTFIVWIAYRVDIFWNLVIAKFECDMAAVCDFLRVVCSFFCIRKQKPAEFRAGMVLVRLYGRSERIGSLLRRLCDGAYRRGPDVVEFARLRIGRRGAGIVGQ